MLLIFNENGALQFGKRRHRIVWLHFKRVVWIPGTEHAAALLAIVNLNFEVQTLNLFLYLFYGALHRRQLGLVICLQVLHRLWIHCHLPEAVLLPVRHRGACLQMVTYLLNPPRGAEVIGKLRHFVRQDLRLGGIRPSTFLGMLRFAYRLSLGARVVERFGLWRKLIILTVFATSIGCHERALPHLLLRLRRQCLFHLGAVVVPVGSLELAGLVDINQQGAVEYQRLVFFGVDEAVRPV